MKRSIENLKYGFIELNIAKLIITTMQLLNIFVLVNITLRSRQSSIFPYRCQSLRTEFPLVRSRTQTCSEIWLSL